MTTRTRPSDFDLDGVICPPRVCRLVASTLARDLRAAFNAYGRVDDELAAWIRAVELAGDRFASRLDASGPDASTRTTFADASGPDVRGSDYEKLEYELITAAHAAEVLGCTASNVRDLVNRGRLTPAQRRPYLF